MHRRSYKEVFSEAFLDARDDGCGVVEAERRAEAAMTAHMEAIMAQAELALEEPINARSGGQRN